MIHITEFQAAADAMWADYVATLDTTGHATPPRLRGIDRFGDSAQLADALLALVMDGTKRATCCLAREFKDDPLLPGDHWIITDGAGTPRCIVRTETVTPTPIRDVSAAFAHMEGEGDRSLVYWKRAHDAYFTRQALREGFTYTDDMIGLCETFTRVWPPE